MTVLDRRGSSLRPVGEELSSGYQTLKEEVGEEQLVRSKLAEESSLSLLMMP